LAGLFWVFLVVVFFGSFWASFSVVGVGGRFGAVSLFYRLLFGLFGRSVRLLVLWLLIALFFDLSAFGGLFFRPLFFAPQSGSGFVFGGGLVGSVCWRFGRFSFGFYRRIFLAV
jgi:hypothetical protein